MYYIYSVQCLNCIVVWLYSTNLYLTPIVHWSKVTNPDTKIIVEMMELLAGSYSSIHNAGVKIKGSDIVPAIMVR